MVNIELEKEIPDSLKNILGKKLEKNRIKILDNSLTICYANNGTGKTTIANNILSTNELNGKKRIKINAYDSYEKNIDFSSEQFWTIGENIKEINDLKEQNINNIKLLKLGINNFFNRLDISTGKKIFKNFLKHNKILNINISNFIIAKNGKIEKILLEKNDIKELFEKTQSFSPRTEKIFDNENFLRVKKVLEEEAYQPIKNAIFAISQVLKSIIGKHLKFVEEIQDYLKTNEFNIDISALSEINGIIERLKEMENCYICDSEISDFNEIKNNINKKIKKYDDQLKKHYEINEIEDIIINLQKNINEENPLYHYVDEMKGMKVNIMDITFLEKTYSNFEDLLNFEDNFMNYLESEFLEMILEISSKPINNSLLNNEKILYLIISNNDRITELHKNKSKINEDEFDFIIDTIDKYVGKERVIFDKKDMILTFDGKSYCERDSFSSGEINFILFSFSLLLDAQKFKDGLIDVICFDDPLTSFDSNYKFFILYLLNKFASEKQIPILILTHSYEVISMQKKSGFKKATYYFLKTLSSETIDNNDLGFQELKEDEIKNISLKNSIKFTREKLEELLKIKEENRVEKISKLIYSFMPILRYLTDLGSHEIGYKVFSELMHYRKEHDINKIDLNKFDETIRHCYAITGNSLDLWNLVKNKVFEKIKFYSLNINFEKLLSINLSMYLKNNTITERSLNIFLKSIYFRKVIEEKCLQDIKAYNRFIEKPQEYNLWRVINESILPKNDQILLKSIRLIIQDILHMEGHLNIVLPSLEYSEKWIKLQEESIKKIILK